MAKKPKAKDILADYQRIVSDIKNKKYKPVYLLMGEEPLFIDKISNLLVSDVIPEEQKAFNLTVLYGKDTKVDTAITACRRFPMMAEHQVVVIREAQALENLEQFEIYFNSPLQSTILAICMKGKSMNKGTKAFKAAQKIGEVFESFPFYDYEVAEWIGIEAKSKGFTIQDKAAVLLSEFLGTDLSKISHEIEKLKTVLPADKKQITADDIEKNVGISKDYNVFELCKAVGARDFAKSYKIVEYFAQSPKDHPFVLTITQLYSYFTKMLKLQMLIFNAKRTRSAAPSEKDKLSLLGLSNSFFLRDYEAAIRLYNPGQSVKAIEYLREYDLKNKGIGNATMDDADLLKELIFKIMH